MYSANCYAGRDYSVGYAVSEHPLGPFVKYEGNPILASNNEQISGPGHHSVTLSPDNSEMFIVYHIHTDPKKVAATVRYALIEWGLTQTVRFG